MEAVSTRPLAATLPELVSALDPLLVGAGVVVLASLFVIVATAILRARRQHRDEVRAVVQALEELRSGRGRGHTPIQSASRLGLVADAVHRLGVDLHGTWTEAETAAERWRAVTDATRDTAIITTDTDGDVRSFSAGATQLTGWDEGEVVSRPAAVLFDENSYKDLLPKLARRSLRTQGVTTRSVMVRRDGSTFRAEVSVRMLMGSSSQPVGFMMLVRDITEQIRLETELRDSERRYRGLVDALTEGVFIVAKGRIVYANPAAEALCGEKGSDLIGAAWRDRVATRDVLVAEAALEALAAGSDSTEALRCRLLGPEGEERARVRIKAASVDFAGGTAAMLLVQDETAERQIEEELRRNESRLDAVLEATSDGVLVLSDDPGSMVQMTNRAFAEIFGVGASLLLGASEDRLARLLQAAADGAGSLVDRLSDDSGAPALLSLPGPPAREVRVVVAPLTGRRGERLGRVVACRDVTEQRQSERELQEQAEKLQLSKVELERSYSVLNEVNRELQSRGEELDGLNQELRQLDKMKSDLIGNVSHELQTPLVSIRGYTEMILKERLGPISEEQRKGLSLSLKNIDRLISMIDNLLAFTRTDPGLRDVKLSRFDLRPLTDEVQALLREPISRKRLEVTVRIEDGTMAIRADRDKILQVFLNLLSNAVKFSKEGGRVELAAAAGPSGYASVSLRDEGVGIPQEALGRIFERHYRVDRPAGDAEGSGIGLTIVRDILRLHGCTIQAQSRLGRGTEFTFTLPLAGDEGGRAVDEPQGLPDEIPEAPPGQSATGGHPVDLPVERERAAPPTPATERPRLRIIRRYKSES